MIDDPYDILGLTPTASKSEVRARFKELAMKNHPDKLHNLSPDERKEKEDYFKQVNVAYTMIMEGADPPQQQASTPSADYWRTVWKRVADQNIWETFVDVAHKYIRRKTHRIYVPVSIEDVRTMLCKKIQLILKGVDEPVYTTINCGDYPGISFEYEAHDGSYHNIQMTFTLKSHELFDVDENGDLHVQVGISWFSYIQGKAAIIPYLDGSYVTVDIPPFHDLDEPILVPGYGMCNNHDLYVSVRIQGCDRSRWDILSSSEKKELANLLEKI